MPVEKIYPGFIAQITDNCLLFTVTIYNVTMHCRSLRRLISAVAVTGLILSSLAAGAQNSTKRGRKFKMPPPSARIEVSVLRDSSGKPIENASVIFHSIENGVAKGNMELKTNEDGKVVIDLLPVGGIMRMQIIAKGFQTFGDDYKIDKDQMAVEVRMKRPGEQYSIYKPHPEASEGGKDSDAPKPAAAPAPEATDKPAAPPSQTQPK
ncbi:MAG TPA: carboxypeptidase-like regulatory domain-containing protein [Terracidiphilus sp.]|jgi:5-hydroxyisourate hydrolase-like protein (transthyretin family)